ncbi:hypothetical protein DL765_004738 [Monosporascus sp. GIB2]|nr:hypothetical protein DL765_004738 [Monosporascus sp. GIB2]
MRLLFIHNGLLEIPPRYALDTHLRQSPSQLRPNHHAFRRTGNHARPNSSCCGSGGAAVPPPGAHGASRLRYCAKPAPAPEMPTRQKAASSRTSPPAGVEGAALNVMRPPAPGAGGPHGVGIRPRLRPRPRLSDGNPDSVPGDADRDPGSEAEAETGAGADAAGSRPRHTPGPVRLARDLAVLEVFDFALGLLLGREQGDEDGDENGESGAGARCVCGRLLR